MVNWTIRRTTGPFFKMRSYNDTIWVNGVFDILHIGHVRLLKYAESLGKVVVGIDSDRRTTEIKRKPIHNEQIRKEMLLSLKCVAKVIIFDSYTEMVRAIHLSKADIVVKGSDYKNKKIPEGSLFKMIHFFPLVEGYSTTKIHEDISNRR